MNKEYHVVELGHEGPGLGRNICYPGQPRMFYEEVKCFSHVPIQFFPHPHPRKYCTLL